MRHTRAQARGAHNQGERHPVACEKAVDQCECCGAVFAAHENLIRNMPEPDDLFLLLSGRPQGM